MIKDARPQRRSLCPEVYLVSSSSSPITMPDPTFSIPVPSEDPKPKKKEESEPNDAKQKQKGEKEQEDLVCLSSSPHLYGQELKFHSQKRIFSSKMSSKCLRNVSGYVEATMCQVRVDYERNDHRNRTRICIALLWKPFGHLSGRQPHP